jgi:hypothetical protein
MPTAVNGSEFLFEWDLQNINSLQNLISSIQFPFQDSNYIIRLQKNQASIRYGYYGCGLYSVEPSSKPGIIHFRFDLVKRLDNTITLYYQIQRDLNDLHREQGKADWIDRATIRDHILKVKMWTSEYDFEYDLEYINIDNPSFPNPFYVDGNKLHVLLKKNEGGTKYGCFLEDVCSVILSRVCLQVDLYARLDNSLVKTDKRDFTFINKDAAQGFEDWCDLESLRDHFLKVKVLILKPFSEFVEKPIGFESGVGILLFKKMSSNLSFMIGDEIVYAIHDILTSRCDYFRAMLEGSFKEAQVQMTVESKIPIQGIEVGVFKMIIEWIYTMDIKSLNNPFSPSILRDLQNVYVAADMYLLPDLCDSIGKYLNYFLNSRNFGEIYQVAKRIKSESLEKSFNPGYPNLTLSTRMTIKSRG